MMVFKYLMAAVNFLLFFIMALITMAGIKEDDEATKWLLLVFSLLPVANMAAIMLG